MQKYNLPPTFPGQILKSAYLDPLGISARDLAEAIGVSEEEISQILLGEEKVTPDIALRLANSLNTSPEFWLGLQINWDLWRTYHLKANIYENIRPIGLH
jgi:addiction module HigA family antidote